MIFTEDAINFKNDEATPENSLGARLRTVREEIYGEHGIVALGEGLGVSVQACHNYEEIGEVMPAQILLRFIELTGVDPLWLMQGEGTRYRKGRRKREQSPTHQPPQLSPA